MPVEVVQHVRRMRGGAQAHLMRADDGHFYVVKFQNNPQHLRVLANELLATRLAESVGLPVPVTEIVMVQELADREHAGAARGSRRTFIPLQARPAIRRALRMRPGRRPGF